MSVWGDGADPVHPDSVAVYELLNDAEALLYVGITHNPKMRFAAHAEDKRWWWEVATWTIEWYETRAIALKVEAATIYRKYPAYNISGHREKLPDQDWFVEHWTDAFSRVRPSPIDLAGHQRELIKAKSLRPDVRVMWPVEDHEKVYLFMRSRARAKDLREHDRWVAKRDAERWTRVQARDARRRLEDMEADQKVAQFEAEKAGPLLTGKPRQARRFSTKVPAAPKRGTKRDRAPADPQAKRDLLADVDEVMDDELVVHAIDVVARLRLLTNFRHLEYQALNGAKLASQLASLGIEVKKHSGRPVIRHSSVRDAITQRELGQVVTSDVAVPT